MGGRCSCVRPRPRVETRGWCEPQSSAFAELTFATFRPVTVEPKPPDAGPETVGRVSTSARRATVLVLIGIVLLSFNLRPTAVSVGPEGS